MSPSAGRGETQRLTFSSAMKSEPVASSATQPSAIRAELEAAHFLAEILSGRGKFPLLDRAERTRRDDLHRARPARGRDRCRRPPETCRIAASWAGSSRLAGIEAEARDRLIVAVGSDNDRRNAVGELEAVAQIDIVHQPGLHELQSARLKIVEVEPAFLSAPMMRDCAGPSDRPRSPDRRPRLRP